MARILRTRTRMSRKKTPVKDSGWRLLIAPSILLGVAVAAAAVWWLAAAPDEVSSKAKTTYPTASTLAAESRHSLRGAKPYVSLSGPSQKRERSMNAAVTEREELDDFIKSAVVSLTEQELDLLQTHSLSELDDELARAEAAYLSANDHNRQESEDRYRMLIGLAAKIADRPVDQPTQAEVERADEYMRQREMLEAEFSHLPTVERENRIAEFKDEFFAEPAGHSEEEQHE